MPVKRRVPVWLPYTSKIEVKKNQVQIYYKGGQLDKNISDIHSILFYGAVCDLSQDFLELCSRFTVPVCIHRRNLAQAVWIVPSIRPYHQEDLLSKQIQTRSSIKKSTHICKKILEAKFHSMEWLNKFPPRWKGRGLDQKEMINIEATHAARYWKNFYKDLAYEEENRRSKNPLSCALDAVSVFVSSIILRWVLFHKLSPYHGFIHRPASYAALVYDLMEPYRGYIEEAIYKELKDFHKHKENLTAIAIDIVKEFMDEKVYTNQTRQIVTFHELLHGIVLALRSYLLGSSKGFLVPIPSKPNGGRPIKAGYKLYGRSAGPTDFWQEAQKISTNSELEKLLES